MEGKNVLLLKELIY